MKKIIMIAAVAALSMASCKKDYTCECVTTMAGISATASSTIKDKKKDAKEACEKGSTSTTVNGVTAETKCAIK